MIRQASASDLDSIVNVHRICFPDSFSTAIGNIRGGALLRSYYETFMKTTPELFVVSDENEAINGFCMGYLCENAVSKEWQKANCIKIAFATLSLLFRGNKAAVAKIKSTIRKSKVNYFDKRYDVDPTKKIDLLSICVLPEKRGSGLAKDLIESYENIGKMMNREACVLTVRAENGRGIGFYEKNGYVVQKRTDDNISYIKVIK